MACFRELRGVNVKFLFSNPEKAHTCAEPRCLTYLRVNIGSGPGPSEEPGKNFAHTGKRNPLRDRD